MSGSKWVITPSWLSESLRSFLYGSSVYFCHLFFISSASVRSIPFLSFIEPIFAWNVPLVSLIFLKRSLVFPILLFSSISLYWLLRKAFLSLLAILWNSKNILWKSAFRCLYLSFSPCFWLLFFSQLFVRPPQAALLLFCISFHGDGLDYYVLILSKKSFPLSLLYRKGFRIPLLGIAIRCFANLFHCSIKSWAFLTDITMSCIWYSIYILIIIPYPT